MGEKKNNHVVLKTAAVAATATAGAYAGYAYYLFRQAFDLDRSRFTLDHYHLVSANERQEGLSWFNNQEVKDEWVKSFDDLKLHGYQINQEDSHNYVLFVHGYHQCAKDMIPYMMQAYERGFNVLSVDARATGCSHGRYTSLGWLERFDVIAWIKHIVKQDSDAKIVLFGVSMGANAIMNACGEYLPSNVVCAIEDSGYFDLFEQFELMAEERKSVNLPIKCFKTGMDMYVRQFLHFSLKDVSTAKMLADCHVPMMFIHSEDDEIVPKVNVFDCYNACRNTKELYVVKGLRHLEARRDEEYFEKVFAFIEKHLNA